MESSPKKDSVPKMGLLGPKNKPEENTSDLTMPINRIANYVDVIRQKREEIKNG